MNAFSVEAVTRAGLVIALFVSLASAIPETPTVRIVKVANNFLASVDAKQRQRILYAFDDNEQRRRWSNFPVVMVPRGGIRLGEMTAAQRSAAMALVASVLSPRGFEKVQQIMEGDEMLKSIDTGGGPPRVVPVVPRQEHADLLPVAALRLNPATARSLVRIFTTSRSSERHRTRVHGCCSSEAIISR